MPEDLTFTMLAFTAVFLVVDPFAALPIFASLTAGDSLDKKESQAFRAAMTAFVTLALFAATGGVVFRMFGISLGSFKIAGGLILFLMATDMMRARRSPTRSTAAEEAESSEQPDVAVVPIGVPILAGPGAIATVMVLMSRTQGEPLRIAAVFAAITLTAAVTWVLLRAAARPGGLLRTTTLSILERVMGLLLASVAVEFVVGGLRDLLPTLAWQG
jgi:multiple antibiotic resistance protein